MNMQMIHYVFDNMDDAVFVTGKQGTIRYANPAAEQLLCMPQNYESVLKIWEVIPFVEENDELIQVFLDAVQTGVDQHSKAVTFKNNKGELRRLLVRVNFVETDNGFFIAVVSDVTELIRVTSAFTRYTSTQIADYVLHGPDGEKQGGKLSRTTILMSDLRGFSAICESMPPDSLVTMLNHYFEVMIGIIEQHNGTVIEFLGDGIFVVFGAPKEDDRHATDAVACALEMQNAMEEVNQWNAANGYPELEMGIGINSGETITGNIGSSVKMKYGCIGPEVNLAGRTEAQTVGGQILITEKTKALLDAPLTLRGTMNFTPKGTGRTYLIYDVTGLGDEYRLNRAEEKINWRPVEPATELEYRLLNENKRVLDTRYKCRIRGVSDNFSHARMETDREISQFSNILFDADGKVYAKVIGEEEGDYVIRFTHTPDNPGWKEALAGTL
jgi:adenylate cyclase